MFHHIGVGVLSDEEKKMLRRAGVSFKQISKASYNVEQAFKFGILSDALEQSVAKQMTFAGLKKMLASGKVFKLNPLEKSALQSLEIQMAGEIRRLSTNIKSDIRNTLVTADKVKNTVSHSPEVLDAAKAAIENRRYVNEVVSEIGHRTQKWGTDLGRMADYVFHTAFDEGRAMNIQKDRGDSALVYKDVYPGACPSCTKLLLNGGVGSEPKIFTVSELKANATNVGRKQKDWKAVLGPIHPWCRCTLQKVPFGMTVVGLQNGEWAWNGNDFIQTEKAKNKVERKSKVKVTIGDKTVEV